MSKLFGWLKLSTVVMLFIFYFFMSLIKLTNPDQLGVVCEISALIIQYSYMSSTLWLSCMSFCMWKTFRKMVVDTRAGKYQWGFQHPNFKWYALCSWGAPLVVTIVTLILQETYKDLDLKPEKNTSFIIITTNFTKC